MKGGKNDKSWLRINTYVNIDTGEVIGHKKPKNYNTVMEISKQYTEDEKYRIIKRTIGCREYGEQQELEFREYRIQ